MFFSAAAQSSRRTASVGPGVPISHENEDPLEESENELDADAPRNTGSIDRGHVHPLRASRRVSADSSTFQRHYVSHREDPNLPPIPPYTPLVASPNTSQHTTVSSVPSTTHPAQHDDRPAQTLEDLRRALQVGLEQRSL